jgi:hypothetical protein
MSTTIAIFGSCVTRDLFEHPRLRPALSVYGARSSVISVVAPPVAIDEQHVVLSSQWQRRCVLADFRKTFFASLAEAAPDWLVIDLIDERFDLLRCAGSLVTRSSAFQASGFADTAGVALTPVRRMSADGTDLFEQAAGEFAARVLQLLPAERVILHRARWCCSYRADGGILAFPDDRLSLCHAQNAMLDHGYDALADAFGGRVQLVDHDPDRSLADVDHQWGLEAYHYDGATNAARTARLAQIVGLA